MSKILVFPGVSKLFRAYGLYNIKLIDLNTKDLLMFQSSFELTGYITSTERK